MAKPIGQNMKAQLVLNRLTSLLLLLACLFVSGQADLNSAADLPQAAASSSKQQEVISVPVSNKLTATTSPTTATTTTTQTATTASQTAAATTAATNVVQRCTRQSMLLARQALSHELDTINAFNAIWFADLDKDELIEKQRAALANIIVSGLSHQLLDAEGQPVFELEASYFRTSIANQLPGRLLAPQPISIKLIRRHTDKCFLHKDKNHYTYLVGVTVGPIDHNLDVAYNLPKEFRLGQPIGWHYAQLRVSVPKLSYEVSLKQVADYNLTSASGCPLEVAELNLLGSSQPSKLAVSVVANGLAANNQTVLNIERLFNDYTRPTIAQTLRQVLKFYLNSKTLPLAAS